MASRLELRTNTTIPETLSYKYEEYEPKQRVNRCRRFFQAPIQKIGLTLRNAFYLPWFGTTVDPALPMNQNVLEKVSSALQKTGLPLSDKYKTIRESFSIKDVKVHLEGSTTQIFTLRFFESKMPIAEKKLRIILFSFNGNSEQPKEGPMQKWNPLTLRALSESPILILKALKTYDIPVHSLVTTSLGNVVLDGLKYLETEEDLNLLPPMLILNRGLTSIWKTASQLYRFPLNYLLYGAAKCSGWTADPEQALLNHLNQEKSRSNPPQRTIVFIEARKDFYFSERGQFDPDIHEKISHLGHRVFRAQFFPSPFQIRAHHALQLNFFENNAEMRLLADSIPLNLKEGETMPSAIAKLFLNPDSEEWHTCFYMCGNDATLDIGTSREVLPLLSAFIEEGNKKMHPDDDYKQAQ